MFKHNEVDIETNNYNFAVIFKMNFLSYMKIAIHMKTEIVNSPINNNPSLVQIMAWCWKSK